MTPSAPHVQIPDDIPDAALLEARQARYQRVLWWVLAVVVALDAFFVWHLFFGPGTSLGAWPRWGWTLFGFGHWAFMALALIGDGSVPLAEATEKELGPYGRAELETMVAEVLRPHKDLERPNVYLRRSSDAAAECVDTWFFDSWRPLNAVRVTSMLLHLLRPDELRAILVHELGHFYRYIYPLRRADLFVFLLFGLAAAEMCWLLRPAGFWTTVLCGALAYGPLMLAFGWAMIHGAQDQEHLSDLFAARQVGTRSMVNALLLLGKGLEASERVYEQILRRLADDPRLPADALDTIRRLVDESLPQRLLTRGEEEPVLDAAFAAAEVEALRKDLSDDETKQKATKLEALVKPFANKPGYALADWSRFDFVVPDLRVDETEYPHLIAQLVAEPDRQLAGYTFDNPKDAAAAGAVHPTLRRRILFLEKNAPIRSAARDEPDDAPR